MVSPLFRRSRHAMALLALLALLPGWGAAQAQAPAAPALPPPDSVRLEQLGLMQGFPPAADKRVDVSNGYRYPQLRWVVQHLREIQPNLTPSETWSTGHRTPYGLAFAPDGRLWELEHGPRGGDELNLIEPGKNYGWPLVSYAVNYNGVPIASPDTRGDLTKPVIYWTPVFAPGSLMFYSGEMFPQWKGSAFASGLLTRALHRIEVNGASATPAEHWTVGFRVRDVAQAPEGALWLIEDDRKGGLYRLTPK